MSASHVSSQSRTRVKLNRVFSEIFFVSPKFPHVPLGVGGWPWTNPQTDRRTDDVQSQDGALHCTPSALLATIVAANGQGLVHRAVKTMKS